MKIIIIIVKKLCYAFMNYGSNVVRVLHSLFNVCLGMYVTSDKRNVHSKSYALFGEALP
jgi:hypothetical protein